ncbi:MAG: family 10 glycosylhydrolase [Candidatus Bathyarchaeia archaeon]
MKKALIVAAVIILSALLVCQASLNQSITIPSSGHILATQSIVRAAESQWRGVGFGQDEISSTNNWTLIAQTCASFGVNFVTIDSIRNYEVFADGTFNFGNTTLSGYYNVSWAISAFHSYGIKVYLNLDTMYKSFGGDGVQRDCEYLNGNLTPVWYYQLGTTPPTGNGGWLDIANPASITLWQSLTTQLVTDYPGIDGLSFDYTRWDDVMPVNPDAYTLFQQQTGLDTTANYTQWIQDIAPPSYGGDGLYYTQWLEWRTNLVTTLVQDIEQWALAINPNLTFGCTPHKLQFAGEPEPDYWTVGEGQDTAAWIKLGLMQWIAPMFYSPTNSTSDVAQLIAGIPGLMQNEENYNTGAAHGIIPICPSLNAAGGWGGTGQTYNTSTFVTEVNLVMANGGDGWLVTYGQGPGETNTAGALSTIPYLAALNLPQTFSLTKITLTALSSTSEQISWTTSSAANSTVEYNSSQLFAWSQLTVNDVGVVFPYWKDSHVTGFLVTDAASVTSHVITLTGLTPGTKYYFRIQSADPSGIATTPVMMFST